MSETIPPKVETSPVSTVSDADIEAAEAGIKAGGEAREAGDAEKTKAGKEADAMLTDDTTSTLEGDETTDETSASPDSEKNTVAQLKDTINNAATQEELDTFIAENNLAESEIPGVKKAIEIKTKQLADQAKETAKNALAAKLDEMMPGLGKIAPFLALFGVSLNGKVMSFITGVFDMFKGNAFDNMIVATKETIGDTKLPFDIDLSNKDIGKKFKKLTTFIDKKIDGITTSPEALKFLLTGKTDDTKIKGKLGTMQENIAALVNQDDMDEAGFLDALQKPEQLAKKVEINSEETT